VHHRSPVHWTSSFHPPSSPKSPTARRPITLQSHLQPS
jgi:hypothetical protein